MGFMESYKRLDNLCRDMNGIGVSGYLSGMEEVRSGAFVVPSWRTDYQQLRHYRHIRNRIAHEVNATEELLCTPEDTAWIEAFHQRILCQTDPLAAYARSHRPQTSSAVPSPARQSAPAGCLLNILSGLALFGVLTALAACLLLG